MSEINDFIQELSERYYNENDVSNITYCLCKSCENFKNLFLKFHFPNIDTSQPIDDISREFAIDDSRPDFMITVHNKQYLIEVKLGDRNQHFEQYIKTFPAAERSYITNYELGIEKEKYKNDYHFHTWAEFIEYLINKDIQDEVIIGYINYLKAVCSYLEVKYMNFESLKGLYYFNNLVTTLVKTKINNINIEEYSSKYNFSDSWSGKYFCMYKDNSKKCMYPWFGIVYDDKGIKICIDFEFESGYCDVLESKTDEIKNMKLLYSDVQSYEGGVTIKLSERKFKEFESTDKVEKQKEIITSFFNETITKFAEFI